MIAEHLLQRLNELSGSRHPSRYLVAFSGGLDSTVLLHALWSVRERLGAPLVAVHVNHALHPDAPGWERQCRRFAERLGVDLLVRRIDVQQGDRRGPEGAARELRYAAIADVVQSGDQVLTAHHEGDQAETLLLNLMRGSGTAGLAGIAAARPFGEGLLLRPLLGVPRREIEAWAAAHALEWHDDPSNADVRFDRNFLRHEVLPALRRRWPAVSSRLARSAGLLAEANQLQVELAEIDLASQGGDPRRLDAAALRELSPARQRNVIRHAIRRSGLPPAPSTRLDQTVRELIPAPPDAQPLVRWPGGELRRFRGTLYVLPPVAYAVPSATLTLPADGSEVCLGASLGVLQLEGPVAVGIDPGLIGDGLRIGFRRGGEMLCPAGREHRQALKKLLQEAGVVPWMRRFLPLLYAGDALVAVADLWVAQEASGAGGYAVRWTHKPPLF